MQQDDLAVLRNASGQALAHQSCLNSGAEVTFDAVRRRDQQQRPRGIARTDDRGIEEEGFAIASLCLGMHACDHIDAGTLTGGDEIVTGAAIVGWKMLCRVDGHDLYFSVAHGIGHVTLWRAG